MMIRTWRSPTTSLLTRPIDLHSLRSLHRPFVSTVVENIPPPTFACTRLVASMAGLDLKIPLLKMSDGNSIPMLGYGTGTAWYKTDKFSTMNQSLVEATTKAAQLGYTHLDGAEIYNTEAELGAAIKASKMARDELFVTTKVLPNIKDIPRAIDASLAKLGLDHVDLYLIHAPFFARDEGELRQRWREMEEVKKSGKARSIGVSNYNEEQLDATLRTAVDPPAINQIEHHPYLQQRELIAYHRRKNIAVSAYGPLTPVTRAKEGPLTGHLDTLAQKYGVTPAEILLRWCIDRDIVAITTTTKEQRMSDYLRALAFKLTPKELQDISDIGDTYHYRGFWNDRYAKS